MLIKILAALRWAAHNCLVFAVGIMWLCCARSRRIIAHKENVCVYYSLQSTNGLCKRHTFSFFFFRCRIIESECKTKPDKVNIMEPSRHSLFAWCGSFSHIVDGYSRNLHHFLGGEKQTQRWKEERIKQMTISKTVNGNANEENETMSLCNE